MKRALKKPESLAKVEVPPDPDGLPDKVFARTAEEAKADEEAAKRDKEDFEKVLLENLDMFTMRTWTEVVRSS